MNAKTQKLQESIQLQNYMLRPGRYVNIDGSFELGWGTAILLGALSAYLPGLLPNALWAGRLGWLLLLGFALSPYLIPKAIKKYITWPRTGYVAYRHDTKSFWVGTVVAVVIAVGGSIALSYLTVSQVRQMTRRLVMAHQNQTGKVSRGYLGVTLQPLAADSAKAFNLSEEDGGVLVGGVIPHSAAETAGMKKGDVILEVNGKKMNDTQALRLLIAETPLGTKINLRILRGEPGQKPVEKTVAAALGELPQAALASPSSGPVSPGAVNPGAVSPGAMGSDTMSPARKVMLAAWCLLIGAALAAYWARKAIRRRIPWPLPGEAAYPSDGKLPRPLSERRFRWMKVGIYLVIFGIPILAGGVIFGLIYLSESVTRLGALSPTPKVMNAIFLASNALLYVMAVAGSIREYPWKWLLLVLLVLGPPGIGLIAPANWFELSRPVILSRPVMLFVGLVWLISGGATLYAYLRHTKAPALEPA